jgi:RNA polymerase subunit RPABC4/transcription elongation factor Spt4
VASIFAPMFDLSDPSRLPITVSICSHCGKLVEKGCRTCPVGSLGPNGNHIAVITVLTPDPQQIRATLDGLVAPPIIEQVIGIILGRA